MGDLGGKVTGGARGIGSGGCECLSEAGASVVVADIDVAEAQKSAQALPGPALAVEHDVRSSASGRALEAAAIETYGKIDVLVNNAGVGPNLVPMHEIPEVEYDRVMDINAKGLFLATRAFVAGMIERQSGRIINISSIIGQTGVAMVLPFVASKFAVRGVTHMPAHELALHNINVNSVHPGVVQTDLHSRVVPQFASLQSTSEDESREWFRRRMPLGRFQTPRDPGEMTSAFKTSSTWRRSALPSALRSPSSWKRRPP